MSYVINYLGGTITIPIGAANTTATPLTLIGRNWTSPNVQQGFGQAINQNFVSILENFANTTAPTSPLSGQFWYDSSVSEIKLNVGTPTTPSWSRMLSGSSTISGIANNTSSVSIPVADGNVNTSVNGVANVLVVTTTGANVTGTMTTTGQVTGGTLASTVTTGTAPITVASQTVVLNLNSEYSNGYTAVFADTPSTIVVRNGAGAIVANVIAANTTISAPTGNITNINSTAINATTIAGTLTTASQPNITSVGTLTSLDVTGTITAASFVGNISGNSTTAASVTDAAQPNITSLGTLTGLTSLGTVNFAGASNVTLGQVGNIRIIGGTNGSFLVTNGSGGLSWSTTTTAINVGTVTVPEITTGATATAGTITGQWTLPPGSTLNATYADLAEYYTIDRAADSGTVVEFGGDSEVTICDSDMSQRVAGVVSTAPAFTMNDDAVTVNQLRAAVALQGRVPCRVVGITRKGDMMVSAGNGEARSEHSPLMGSVIGKALEDKLTPEPGIIEVVVGRL